MNTRAIREACFEANRQLPATGLVDLTFGNVSVLDPAAAVFAIKPSGVDYADLSPQSMVIVDLDGAVVEGALRPSSDTPTHACLLRAFHSAGICAIVHTHSRCAVAFAQAARALHCLGTTHADYFRGTIPVTRSLTALETEAAYELNTGKVILEAFAGLNPSEVPAVFVRHHGPFAWGPTAPKAVETAQALEIVADMALKTVTANPATGPMPRHLSDKHFLRKHGTNAYYGQ